MDHGSDSAPITTGPGINLSQNHLLLGVDLIQYGMKLQVHVVINGKSYPVMGKLTDIKFPDSRKKWLHELLMRGVISPRQYGHEIGLLILEKK